MSPIVPIITTLGLALDEEQSAETEETRLLLEQVKRTTPPIDLTSEQINNEIRKRSLEIAELHDWHDSGVLGSPEEINNVTDAITKVTCEIIQLLVSDPKRKMRV